MDRVSKHSSPDAVYNGIKSLAVRAAALGTIMEMPTANRRTLPVTFRLSPELLKLFPSAFAIYKSPHKVFVDMFFDDISLFNKTQHTFNNGKLIEKQLVVTDILKHDYDILVFKANIDELQFAFKCAWPSFSEQYNRDRLFYNKFKTTMQREVEGFRIMESIRDDDRVKLMAHGNMWIHTEGNDLIACLEIVLMEMVDGLIFSSIISKFVATSNPKAFDLIALAFQRLYMLHEQDIVHGDPGLSNIMQRKNTKITWIDFERSMKKDRSFTNLTWNTLKLIDINILLLNSITLIGRSHRRDFTLRNINLREFKNNLFRENNEYNQIILPHRSYLYHGMIHDNSSCAAMHEIFNQGWIDIKYLSSDAFMTSLLRDLTIPDKLRKILNNLVYCAFDVIPEDYRFPGQFYDDYKIPQDSVYANQAMNNNTAETKKKKEKVSTQQLPRNIDQSKQVHSTENDRSYFLILNGQQFYSNEQCPLVYFKSGGNNAGQRFSMAQQKKGKIENLRSFQLYSIKKGENTPTPTVIQNNRGGSYLCFCKVKDNFLEVFYYTEYGEKFNTYASYDLNFHPPKKIEKIQPIPENDTDASPSMPFTTKQERPLPNSKPVANTTNLVVNGDQYLDESHQNYIVLNERGKYFLCRTVSRSTPIRLSEELIYPVYVSNRANFEPLIETGGVSNAFGFTKLITGQVYIKVLQNGTLQVYIRTQDKTIEGYRYDIRNGGSILITEFDA